MRSAALEQAGGDQVGIWWARVSGRGCPAQLLGHARAFRQRVRRLCLCVPGWRGCQGRRGVACVRPCVACRRVVDLFLRLSGHRVGARVRARRVGRLRCAFLGPAALLVLVLVVFAHVEVHNGPLFGRRLARPRGIAETRLGRGKVLGRLAALCLAYQMAAGVVLAQIDVRVRLRVLSHDGARRGIALEAWPWAAGRRYRGARLRAAVVPAAFLGGRVLVLLLRRFREFGRVLAC